MRVKFEHQGPRGYFGEPYLAKHGPQVWPWWRLFSWRLCRPPTGWRLWVYTRWASMFVGIYFFRGRP